MQCPNREIPYSVYCFPAEMTKGKERDARIQALQRENQNRTNWTPKISDGIPTKANQLPTMRIGHHKKTQKNSTPSFQTPITSKENTSRGR